MSNENLRKAFTETGTFDEHVLCACAYAILYFNEGFKQNARQLLHFYETVLPLIKDEVTFFDVDGHNKPKKIKKSAFELMPFWVSEESKDRGIYGLRLETGSTKNDISDKGFYLYQGMGPGFVKFFLPLEFLEQSPGRFLELMKQAVGDLRFLAGHAGFGVHLDESYYTADEGGKIYHLSQRYRGVDLYRPVSASRLMKHGLTTVNWLTFVGEEFLERVGGQNRLKANLTADPEVLVHALPHGVLIQAGPAPSLGDVKAGDTLSHYRRVGAALRPLRVSDEAMQRADHIGGRENTRAWLDRFF